MYKPELDKKSLEEVEKEEWRRQTITDKAHLDTIIEAYKEMGGIDLEKDVYVRIVSEEDFKTDKECSLCYVRGAEIGSLVLVYVRKGVLDKE